MRHLLCAACLAYLAVPALIAQQPPLGPQITRITGNLYRGHAFGLYNVFLVTPDGIILADPINTPRRSDVAVRRPTIRGGIK